MHGINLFEYGFDADSILLAGQLRGSDEAGCPKSGQGLIGPVKLVSVSVTTLLIRRGQQIERNRLSDFDTIDPSGQNATSITGAFTGRI